MVVTYGYSTFRDTYIICYTQRYLISGQAEGIYTMLLTYYSEAQNILYITTTWLFSLY